MARNVLKCGGSHTLETVFFILRERLLFRQTFPNVLSLCFPPYKQQIELDSQTTVDVGEEEQTLTCTYTLLKDLPLSLTKTTFCYSALLFSLDDLNKSFGALLLIP